MYRLLQGLLAGIILAVGDHENGFALQAGVGQVISRGDNRVIERRTAARFYMFECGLQLLDVGSKFLIEIVLVVEIDNKNLVIGIARLHQIQRSLVNGITLLSHRAGIVDHNTDGNREIFLMEVSDLLRLIVLKDGEVSLVQIIDQVVSVIDNGRVQGHFASFRPEYEPTILTADRRLALISRPGWRVALRAMLLWWIALARGRRSLSVLCLRRDRWSV